ncbi:MAG: energy transducer TonB [Campylobacteraceae bacterium]|jgi:protein TonB|nr:energy transducer TonB [Campylobacteraceae bacterium]
MKKQNSLIGLLVGFVFSCIIHGGFFYIIYNHFIDNEKDVIALREDLKAPLKMALTTFAIEQPKEEPQEELQKPEVKKPKLPEPKHHEIIKKEPVPVPIPVEEQPVEEQQEDVSEQNNVPITQPIQAQNSGAEAVSSSMTEDDHIMAIIRAAIDKEAKKDYPSKAKKMRMEGIAKIKIRIDQEGKITLLEITESSGFSMLDQSAIKSIQKASKNFPKPSRILLFILPISYEIV